MSDTSSEADQQSSLGSSSPTPPPTGGEKDKPNIGAKIHQFENGEREKAEKEEKERKRALFEKKLSKFDKQPETASSHPPLVKKLSHVDKMTKKFSYERKSEQEEREIQKRREEFERKRSGFMSEDGECTSRKSSEDDGGAEETRGRLSKMRLMFEDRDAALAAAEAEAEAKRKQDEEAQARRQEFEAKSSMFKKLSASQHDR